MTSTDICRVQRPQRGFVLITSLIFLALVTLIAVSAMHRSTSQQRMAANQRDTAQARQTANAGLRYAETLLEQPGFDSRPKPGDTVAVADPDAPGTDKLKIRIWGKNPPWQNALLDPKSWQNAQRPDRVSALPPVEYYVQYDCDPASLYPDSQALCNPGVVRFRLTARAHGRSPNAVAVTQSVYRIK